MNETAVKLVNRITNLAAEKKAVDTVVLEIGKVSLIADYFVITGGNNRLQVKAIADHIMEILKKEGYPLLHKEGYPEGIWVLLDYGLVVVHLFQPEERRFYNLERLWGHAPQAANLIEGVCSK
ncbi:MAG: Ribosomal silencing factor RsfS [Syntrophomonadaceae bacterium]|nr:Ribosomal silencing factor RsfS [Bacillota bacterium]